jgi:Oxidoreductase family, NAD-binding Rossmann fold/Oxidoreductase family, C-terminal alpha/beta domain
MKKHHPLRAPFSRRKFLRLGGAAAGAMAFGFPAILKAAGTDAKLKVAHIGLGAMGRGRLQEMTGCGANIVALCDVDENQFAAANKILEKTAFKPAHFVDYRELLDKQKDLDGVVIATPDHWHAPIATAALKAGKHVFCEKPLAHTIGEARALRQLAAKHSKLVTQMGNQGSASPNMRRAIELIQGGAIGQVREVHCWVNDLVGCHPGLPLPTVADPIPVGLHWDAWLGPAPSRLYKKDFYHPWNWRGWYDFGNGVMADFGCHNLNLPFRALKLDYAKHIEAEGELTGLPTYSAKNRIRFDFAARGALVPVTVWWYDAGRIAPETVMPKSVIEQLGEMPKQGVLLLGDNGFTFGGCWNGADYIKLNDEPKVSGILNHSATKNIPETLPRSHGHLKEWVNACTGGPATFSSFEIGGHLTEIALSGVLALKLQKPIDWNGEKMRAENAPDAKKFIEPNYRKHWTV